MDADVIIERPLTQISKLVASETDFAIFNWLAEKDTSAYLPLPITIGTDYFAKRFYRFSHSIDALVPSQLICSGAVQFWNKSEASFRLLIEWQSVIITTPQSEDDKCLDFAFNNRDTQSLAVKTFWLDKSYCRYPWWIFNQPVINHPDFPASVGDTVPLDTLKGKQRFYLPPCFSSYTPNPVLRTHLIDTALRMLWRIEGNQLEPAGNFNDTLYLQST